MARARGTGVVSAMTVAVLIIGAGPAGFYTAEALLNRVPDVRIDIVERLPSPFGLVRAGVAPDHQSTKRIADRFGQTAAVSAVRFFGNVEVGRDVTLADVRALYDAVVLAVGAPRDRTLGIPGEDTPGVYGSAAFVGWYNGHPDYHDLDPRPDTETAVVIGNGNVALDIARVLAKSAAEMATSDITDDACSAIANAPLTTIVIAGRRGPLDAKFAPAELREIGQLATCVPVVDGRLIAQATAAETGRDRPAASKNLSLFKQFAGRDSSGWQKQLRFDFYKIPREILGADRVQGIRFESARVDSASVVGTGAFEIQRCGLIIIAIGYRASPIPDLPYDEDRGRLINDDGRIESRLYAVGWAKRGPTGVIGTNKPDGVRCAEQIGADVPAGDKPGRPAFEALLKQRRVQAVTYQDWQRIDAAEIAHARAPAPRRKFTRRDDMLSVIKHPS